MTTPRDYDVSLRDYIERILTEHMEQHRLMADAVKKDNETTTVRLAGMNEWRQSMSDLASKFLTRELFDARMNDVLERIEALDAKYDARTDSINVRVASMAATIALAVSIGTVLVSRLWK